jgi:hypothetical protein
MSKLSNLTDKQIHEAIEAMQNGIAIKPNSEEAEALQVSINRAYAELERRAQKKSELSGNAGQLQKSESEETEKIKRAVLNPSLGIQNTYDVREMEVQAQHADTAQSEQAFKIQENRVVVGRASDVVVTVPVAEVLVGGKLRVLTQTEILGLLKTYFKGVATGASMMNGQYSKAYSGEMSQTVYRLFDAWNLIYQQTNEGAAWPPLVDCFPGWNRARQEYKISGEILWRWASRDNT